MHHYRPDIDGLRAVAIVPVVLFHAGLGAFSGGFVGVDVFFVISGFLITRLISHEIDGGTFTLANFYERRIRRLFPALFAMLFAASAVAAWLLLPADLVDFAKSVLATGLFGSNFLFWGESGYFGRAAEEIPLLHTWSLAVEEQYYILFPLFLLWVAARGRKRYVTATALVTAATFALSVAYLPIDPDATFYLAPFRAWELGLGALLALGAFPAPHRHALRTLAGGLGIAAIAVAVTTYTSATPFPGAAALLPCLGAAAIIWAGSGGHHPVGDALSRRPVVLVGLISYSLYLWHWPILALWRYFAVRDLTPVETAAAVAMAVAAAVVSWRWIERPFRGRSGLFDRRRLFASALAVMVLAVGASVLAIVAEGWPGRLEPEVRLLMAGASDRRPRNWTCENTPAEDIRAGRLCRVGSEQAAATTFLVWGDSHARVMSDAIGAAAARAGTAGLLALRVRCAPLPGAHRSEDGSGDQCHAFNQSVLDFLAGAPAVTDVILAGRWGLLAEAARYGHEAGEAVYLTDGTPAELSVPNNQRLLERSLRHSVATLVGLGKRVWIVAPVPEIGWDVPSVLARAARFERPPPAAPSRVEFEARQAFVTGLLRELDAQPGVEMLQPDAVLCPGERCSVVHDGRPLYFDSHHLSLHGATLLEPMFGTVFAR